MRLPAAASLPSALVLLATSLLAVLRAPTYLLWMLAIGVTELGYALALICIAAGVLLASRTWAGKVAVCLCMASAVLALSPLLRASVVARNLPSQLQKAFGAASPSRSSPIVYADLLRGVGAAKVNPQTIAYRSIGATQLSLDFYRAENAATAPLIVVIHGGSWRSGDNKDFVPMDQYLAGRGFAVADVLYRFAPEFRFPAASEDVRAAIEFLRSHSKQFKIDANRIVLLGRSAGGQIALNVAYSARDVGIRGVISFYGPTELRWGWEHPGNPLVIDTRGNLRDYLGGSPSNASSNYDAASPGLSINSNSPPTLLFHGGRDELVSSYHSESLSKRLTDASVRNLDVVLPWATHGFDYFLRGPGGQISTYAIEYFLARVF